MDKARQAIRSVEITRAVRSATLDGIAIKKKQALAFLDRALVAVGNESQVVMNKALSKAKLNQAEVVTIYYGEMIEKEQAEAVSAALREKYPNLQIEVVRGGQPHYEYIISVE